MMEVHKIMTPSVRNVPLTPTINSVSPKVSLSKAIIPILENNRELR